MNERYGKNGSESGLQEVLYQQITSSSDEAIKVALDLVDGGGPMSRWEEVKMLLLALAISVALATAGALLAIGLAHL